MGYDRYFGFDLDERKTLQRLLAEATAEAVADVPVATLTVNGTVKKAQAQNPAAAADVAALKSQFDALLTKLKDAGLMSTT